MYRYHTEKMYLNWNRLKEKRGGHKGLSTFIETYYLFMNKKIFWHECGTPKEFYIKRQTIYIYMKRKPRRHKNLLIYIFIHTYEYISNFFYLMKMSIQIELLVKGVLHLIFSVRLVILTTSTRMKCE